ncbi:glycosyltransferase [Romboutsia sp.]|uniref:glycosyltransferase n=1 Tax=Romboutsia sp. TaxID=1965302 RepID=UPI003F3AA614
MSKKILQVTTISPTLGFLTEHIRLLISQGNEVQIATNITSDLSKGIEEQNLAINQIDFRRNPLSFQNIKAYFQIKKLQKKKEYDIVHVHTPIAAFITRFALKKFRKKGNLKIVYTAHGFHFYKGAPLKNWVIYYTAEKIASKWCDIIITMNEEDYKFATTKFNNDGSTKVFKVGGVGVDIKHYSNDYVLDTVFKESLGLKKEDFVISIIGELSHRKNQIQIIKAVEILKKEYEDIKLLIVGDGYLLDEYKEYISATCC